ncbi:MAG: biotin synthase BioB [Planctomycetota bacterium]|jgi:biotin synthase
MPVSPTSTENLTLISELRNRVIEGGKVSTEEALHLLGMTGCDRFDLLAAANRIRVAFHGESVHLCGIVNAKSGSCPEDCTFCAQSAHHDTDAPVYGLLDVDEIVKSASEAVEAGAKSFGIVSSGVAPESDREFEAAIEAVRRISSELPVEADASLGCITYEQAAALKEAGCARYHHNLETARSYYPEICTTRNYNENVETVRNAVRAGLEVCSGGILGMGETAGQRIELAVELRELGVSRVPLNFLMPVKGTRLESMEPLPPLECLSIIAVYRFLLPGIGISVCAGRDTSLRDLQSLVFFSGATGCMIGNYLTTAGRSVEADRQLLKDLEVEIR